MKLVSFLALFSATQVCLGEVRYRIVQIEAAGPLRTHWSNAVGINNLGQVVGTYESPDRSVRRVFFYSPASGMLDLGPQQADNAEGWRINDHCQITGYTPGGAGFRYTPGIGFEFLQGLYAYGINSRGQVAGGSVYAFRYTDGIGIEDLGETTTVGLGINEQGWVVGVGPGVYAFLHRDDLGIVDLGPGEAFDVNDQGIVVGSWWGFPAVGSSPVVWTDGQPRLLGTFGGATGIAYAINNKDQVVGEVERSSPRGMPGFIWTEEEGMRALDTLVATNSGWILSTAYDINDHGWIVGYGSYQEKPQGYLLIPIPPKLEIALAGANVVITWSPHWPRLVLETASYHSPTNWQAVPGGANDPVILPATGPGQVFRLTQHDSLDPKLTATVSGTNLVISWAPPWPDYTLESASTMPAASWERVPGATNSPVTLPLSLGPRFFRLRK